METIQISVSSELAQQLRVYQNELPRLLELGLGLIKSKKIAEAVTHVDPVLLQKNRVINVLRQAGARGQMRRLLYNT